MMSLSQDIHSWIAVDVLQHMRVCSSFRKAEYIVAINQPILLDQSFNIAESHLLFIAGKDLVQYSACTTTCFVPI
jgi:hypothetical protein